MIYHIYRQNIDGVESVIFEVTTDIRHCEGLVDDDIAVDEKSATDTGYLLSFDGDDSGFVTEQAINALVIAGINIPSYTQIVVVGQNTHEREGV